MKMKERTPYRIEDVPPHLQRYVDYINNTGQVPLAESAFDEDWEPIGPMVREEMRGLGLIVMGGGERQFASKPGIYLRPDLSTSDIYKMQT